MKKYLRDEKDKRKSGISFQRTMATTLAKVTLGRLGLGRVLLGSGPSGTCGTERILQFLGKHARALSSWPPHTTLTMPSLSPTMTKGNLSKWVKTEVRQRRERERERERERKI